MSVAIDHVGFAENDVNAHPGFNTLWCPCLNVKMNVIDQVSKQTNQNQCNFGNAFCLTLVFF